VPDSDDFAFGFLDPALVIRGVHLMPAFLDDRTPELLHSTRPSLARDSEMEIDDWTNFYVGMYVSI
jgi:hypothetical protein